MPYNHLTPANKRPCPNFNKCKRFRKTGEIFCHECYFRLPKQLRDLLWGRNIKALLPSIEKCMEYLRVTEEVS
jgi:hypothetical protein